MTRIYNPLWRFVVTDLDGVEITMLDHLASDKKVTFKLNEPCEISFTVPSDNTEVNRLHTDGFPYIAEGVRQVYCFRRESDTAPFYTLRAAGLVMQVDDAAHENDARTTVTAWDPWQYLFSLPCVTGYLSDPAAAVSPPFELIPATGITYTNMNPWEIIQDQFDVLFNGALGGPTAAQTGFIDWSGSYAAADLTPFKIEQGTTLGQLLQNLCSTGWIDIEMAPIYPSVGVLATIIIHRQDGVNLGMGTFKYGSIFSWDKPGRNVVGIDDMFDGIARANYAQFYNGQGGPPVTPFSDQNSIDTYGEYWVQQFFPAQPEVAPVEGMAEEQVNLRGRFKQTLTVNPVPGMGVEPILDYYLGDRVPINASDRLRQPLPEDALQTGTEAIEIAWQRIYGIPIEIDDNSVETVVQLIAGPVGAP